MNLSDTQAVIQFWNRKGHFNLEHYLKVLKAKKIS